MLAYALSPQGQAVVEEHGLISPTLRPAPAAAPPAEAAPSPVAPATPAGQIDRLRAYVAGAKKLGIVFHFQPNSTALDQYGERDLDRVANYLVSMHDGGDHLLLAGFADNQGDAASNVDVSRKRRGVRGHAVCRARAEAGGCRGLWRGIAGG